MMFTTPGLSKYISGVILHEETAGQQVSCVIAARSTSDGPIRRPPAPHHEALPLAAPQKKKKKTGNADALMPFE